MYLSQMAKTALLSRDDEVRLCRNVHERQKELELLVLESPVAMREIRNWEHLLSLKEMSPKELMPRGTRPPRELAAMRRKMRRTSGCIARSEARISRLAAELRRACPRRKAAITRAIEARKKAVLKRIVALDLNPDKIKRLANKIKSLAAKVRQCRRELEAMRRRSGAGRGRRSGRPGPGGTRMRAVRERFERLTRTIPMPVDRFLELDRRITALEEHILADKLRIIRANLRLVVAIARKKRYSSLEMSDLIQEGGLGLMKAVDKFEYRKKFKFSTYATWWVHQSMNRAIADQADTIRIPVHMKELCSRIHKAGGRCRQELGRDPTPQEYARRLGVPLDTVKTGLKIMQRPVSLDTPIGEDGDSRLEDLIKDPSVPEPSRLLKESMLRARLERVLSTLTGREASILKLRFGIGAGYPRTLDEVGRLLRITRERVRQIESKAVRKLRHPSRSGALREYCE
ncbi:MAG: sigma-70 family RNA polymerase sigma factor [Elusimicrobiota bacterium]